MGRRGFTLIEVLLALLLSAMLLAAIAMAIDVHLRTADVGRTDVEEAQLARALLHLIADDLRGVPPRGEQHSVAGHGVSFISHEADSSGETDEEEDAVTSDEESGSDAESDVLDLGGQAADSSAGSSVPGLFGTADQLQMDVCRLPRTDQIRRLMETPEETSFSGPSGIVKTVAYYVVAGEEVRQEEDDDGREVGLVRCELDRALRGFEGQPIADDDLRTYQQPLAKEVEAIEFRYYDGSRWVEEWDSSTKGGLPTAVEITVSIWPPGQTNPRFASENTSQQSELQPVEYRLLVDLPNAGSRAQAASSTKGAQP